MSPRIPCHGQAIKQFRERLRWTQETLACQSHLSVRVIAKAESGGTINLKTAEAIAGAFTQAGIETSAAELHSDPAALARQFLANYGKYQAECVGHSRQIISPAIVAFVDGDPASNPLAGEYHGIAEFDRFFKIFFGLFVRDGGTLDKPQIVTTGNEVIAYGHEFIRVPEQPPPQVGGFVMLRMRFEAGLMVRFEDYYEANGMMHTLQQWLKEYPDAAWVKHLNVEAMKGM